MSLEKDSQRWTIAEYAYWKAFCDTHEFFHEGFGGSHPLYPQAIKAVGRYEAFKERARKVLGDGPFKQILPSIK